MTDFDKPYELREFKFEWKSFSAPKCVFCHNPSYGNTIGFHITTAQDGFECSSADWICIECITKLYNVCKQEEWIFNKKGK